MKMQTIPMACLAVLLAIPAARAIQPPADDSPAPPSLEQRDMPLVPREVADDQEALAGEPPAVLGDRPAAKPGFLGINVGEIPEMLGAHLDVPDGQGVLVRVIAPGSSAEKAGMQMHDVILKIADQPVVSHHDVLNLVSKHQSGDKLKIDVLRKGDRHTLEAVLDPRPDDLGRPGIEMGGMMGRGGVDDFFFDELPQDHAARIRGMIERNLRALRDPGGVLEDEVFQDAFHGMREQMERLLADPKPFEPLDENGGFGNIRMNAGATVRLMDEQGSIELKVVDGSKEVSVRDIDHEIIWTGPWDTDQDKAAAPDDIRERIERLNIEGFQQGNGLRLQFFQDR